MANINYGSGPNTGDTQPQAFGKIEARLTDAETLNTSLANERDALTTKLGQPQSAIRVSSDVANGAVIAVANDPNGSGSTVTVSTPDASGAIGFDTASKTFTKAGTITDQAYTVALTWTKSGSPTLTVSYAFRGVVPSGTPVTEAAILVICGQSQGQCPNTSQATRPANISAIPAASASTAGARIWQPSTNSLAGYRAGYNSCPYGYAVDADQPYGPEAEFARLWTAANPTKQLIIIKLNIGSTPLQKAASFQAGRGNIAGGENIIECWDPSLANDPSNSTPANRNINASLLVKAYLDGAIAQLQAEGKTITRLGAAYIQGQNDAYFSATSTTYTAALTAWTTWGRTNLLAGGTAPLAIGQVEDSTNWPYRRPVRVSQQEVVQANANTYLTPTDDIPIGADMFHYSPAGTITMGSRLYEDIVGPRARSAAGLNSIMTSPAYTAGKYGNSLTGGWARGGRLPAAPFSMGMWISGTATTGLKVAAGQLHWFFLGSFDGRIRAGLLGTNQTTIDSANVVDSGSHWISCDVTDSGMTLYVDGVQAATTTNGWTASAPYIEAADNFEVRTFIVSRGTYDWPGGIDELVVFRGTRGTFVPSAPFTGGEAGLLQLYHYNSSGLAS